MTELPAAELTLEQHDAFLAAITEEPGIGNVAALRHIGLTGHKRDLRAFLTDDLLEEAREARGWSFLKVEAVIWEVAQDKDHPAWQRTSALLAKAYGGAQFRDQVAHEHTGRLAIDSPDVASAIDRFTALAASAVGAATRAAEAETPLALAASRESTTGVRVGQVDSPPEPTTP